MHPAASVIVFTTLSGIGFGLIGWLGLGFGPSGHGFAWLSAFVSGFFVAVGLISSSLHLKRPDRAWRAFSQWRSSWLSREGVLAIVTSAVYGLYALIWIFGGQRVLPLGIAAAVLSAMTVYSTSMIYAQLRTVPRWATPLTSAYYLAFAVAGGALALAAIEGRVHSPVALFALVALVLAWIIKFAWWQRAERTSRASAGGSPEQATGLGRIGTVRQLEPPHTGPNYLMTEMMFVVARNRARALRMLAIVLGAIVPLLLVALAVTQGAGPLVLVPALIIHLAGLMCERWLFFAQAEHVVGAYYGHR